MSNDKSIADLLYEGRDLFERHNVHHGHGLYDAWDEAVYLLSHALDLSICEDRSILNSRLSEEEALLVRSLFRERAISRTPSAYLTSCAYFFGLPFYVDRRVLIPRSPIGRLILEEFKPWVSISPTSILDLCTGSGCIGISCAYAFPNSRITISDISEGALSVARRNVRHHKCLDRIQILESDLFLNIGKEKYDLIVSNPPYVDSQHYQNMPCEYFSEPVVALVSGDDGLDLVRQILAEAASYLHDEGVLIVEVGHSAAALEQAYPELPLLWIDFNEGDSGVFVLTREQLSENRNFCS